ncbi:MAG TPA: helix-turn-helix domain-containing protein [Vicinamibacteria bacterium]|nr:helix-turn-helix domain-containing protein [Vicinamibacteria bacterium]
MAISGQPENGGNQTHLKYLLEAYERRLIADALAASGGHQRRTAARLGILPTTLHEKMKRLGLLRRRPQTLETLRSEETVARPGLTELVASREGREA